VQNGIALAVNDNATIDAVLAIGTTADSITITGDVPLLETQSGTIKGLVDQQRIVDLPLNGRDITQLVGVQAGVISRSQSSSEGNAYVVNGSRQNGVSYLLDSGMNTDSYRNYSGLFPNPDAIQEFSVQKSNFSAEYANATGAVVSVVTKSGTNQFHGSLFEFLRNGDLNARNFFAAKRDSLKRNQFGGTLGGPIVKDKVFLFFSYQGTRLRSDPQLTKQFLPTAAMRAGNFSSVATPIRDPLTGQPFPNNQVPLSRLSPVTQAFLKYLPDPGTADGSRFTGFSSRPDANEYTGKVDWNLSRHRLSGRIYSNMYQRPFTANVQDYASMYTSDAARTEQPYVQWTANDLYTISPSIINSFTFSYRGRRTLNDWSAVTLPLSFVDAGVKNIAVKDPASVYISVSGGFLARPGWSYDKRDHDYQFSDSATWIRGSHEIKFGGEFLRTSNDIRNDFRTMGLFTFDGSISGNAMADFMLGNVYQFWQGGGEYKKLAGTRWGLFLQDNYRVNPNLTLNLGLRWDPQFPYHDDLGRVQCFVPGAQSQRYPKAPAGYLNAGDQGCPEGGFNSYLRSWSPRLGFAWRPNGGKTVVRGGFGLFWNPQFTSLYNTFVDSAPFSPQVVNYGVSFANPYGATQNPFPGAFAPFNPPTSVDFIKPLGQFGVFAKGFRPSYNESFNLTLEREVMKNLVARASYVATLGRHLSYPLDLNYARYVPGNSTVANIQQRRPYADFGSILNAYSDSTSSYHGLQLSVERRLSGSLSFEANYTFSKAIDESSADPTPGQGTSIVPTSRLASRGLADFDIRHRFVLSYVWQLPTLKNANPIVRQTVGGWESSGFMTLQSGSPFSVLAGTDRSLSGIGADYADLVGNPYLDTSRSRAQLVSKYFNTSAFTPNAPGTFGTSPRNLLRGPGLANFDLSLMKRFQVREGKFLQFRTEMFNVFNRPNFNNPFAAVSTPSRLGKIESAADPRIIQFGLKFLF
jgi:outer membrane receptor protein involved in Fe transport